MKNQLKYSQKNQNNLLFYQKHFINYIFKNN
jgi:hypothetical protein